MTDPMAPIPFLDRLGEQLEHAEPAERRPPFRLLSAAAVLLVVLLGIGGAMTLRSDPVSAGVDVTRSQGTVQVRIFGRPPTAGQLEDLLHRNGLTHVTVTQEPVAPELVGRLFPAASSPRAEAEVRVTLGDRPLGTLGSQHEEAFDTIVFPKNWDGELGLLLGRKAHGGERYFINGNALRKGGLLECLRGATARQVEAAAEARGLDVLWRQVPAGGYGDVESSRQEAMRLRGWLVLTAEEVDDHTVNVILSQHGEPFPGLDLSAIPSC